MLIIDHLGGLRGPPSHRGAPGTPPVCNVNGHPGIPWAPLSLPAIIYSFFLFFPSGPGPWGGPGPPIWGPQGPPYMGAQGPPFPEKKKSRFSANFFF